MKKLGVFAVTMALGASAAFAASLSVPWFVDNAPAANKVPGVAAGVTGIVTLKNNTSDTMTLTIAYYAQDGTSLGPAVNSFTISGNSSAAFRPGADDPDTAAGGQEGVQGLAVPNRPTTDGKKNGAAVISWPGSDAAAVQGMVTYFQTTIDPNRGDYNTLSYAYLLPPGVS
ncbi:MAG: hypothetical protein HYV27_23275 [Candidatus Hydrogenedentes bacterium]|nr:hypothetical protein [Candidatus Hydrogenedentota bacterium]